MKAEHIHQCLQEAKREKETDATHWQKVGDIVQAVSRDGTMDNESN